MARLQHQYGQKVRGQATRSTGRTGATVGVTKKAIQQAEKESEDSSSSRKARSTTKVSGSKIVINWEHREEIDQNSRNQRRDGILENKIG